MKFFITTRSGSVGGAKEIKSLEELMEMRGPFPLLIDPPYEEIESIGEEILQANPENYPFIIIED